MRRELLNPFRYGFYALQLFSHKVLRRMAVFPLLLLFVVSPLLWPYGPLYQLATLMQIAFYGCGLLGLAVRRDAFRAAEDLHHPILLLHGQRCFAGGDT